MSLQCRAGLGTGVGACGPGSADSVLSWCHPIPGEQGWHGGAVAAHPGSHEKQDNHKLSLHLFPGKGWFVVTSGWLTSPTCVTSCPESSLSSSSAGDRGALLAPQINPRQVLLMPGMQEPQGAGAHPAHQTGETQGSRSWDFTNTTPLIWVCWEGGRCRIVPLESSIGPGNLQPPQPALPKHHRELDRSS